MTTDLNQANKQLVWDHWTALERVAEGGLDQVMSDAVDAGLLFHGPDPVNDLHGVDAFLAGYWLPLRQSFSGLKRRIHLVDVYGGYKHVVRDGREHAIGHEENRDLGFRVKREDVFDDG